VGEQAPVRKTLIAGQFQIIVSMGK